MPPGSATSTSTPMPTTLRICAFKSAICARREAGQRDLGLRLHMQAHGVKPLLAIKLDEEMRAQSLAAQKLFLELGRGTR